jgi:hypothetical protein
MSPAGRNIRRLLGIVGLLVALSAAIGVLGYATGRTTDEVEEAISITAGIVSIVALVASPLRQLLNYALKPRDISDGVEPELLRRVSGHLAFAVKEQWQAEAAMRRLQDPWPLPVRWHPAPAGLADHTRIAFARRNGAETATDLGRTLISGGGDVGQMADLYRSLPSKRLVVLGSPGSGKTIASILLTLQLLSHRRPDTPIPVLISLADWDPRGQSLVGWMSEILATTYPVAGGGRRARAVMRRLITTHRLLPVLDGLDEISPARHRLAMSRLNRGLSSDAPVVITCRTQQYEAIVQAGDVLTGAAVVTLEPLDITFVKAYLEDTTAPTQVAKWTPVFDQLTSEPSGPLAHVLTNPLLASLARTVYSDTLDDPAELLSAQLDDEQDIANRLLDRLIPATYAERDLAALDADGDSPAHDAERWLTFLAIHARSISTSNIDWWDLEKAVPPIVPELFYVAAVGIQMTVTFGKAAGLICATAFIALILGFRLRHPTVESLARWYGRRRAWRPAGAPDRAAPTNRRPGSPRFRLSARTLGIAVAVLVSVAAGLGASIYEASRSSLLYSAAWGNMVALAVVRPVELFTSTPREPATFMANVRFGTGYFRYVLRSALLGMLLFVPVGLMLSPYFGLFNSLAVEGSIGLLFGLWIGLNFFDVPADLASAVSPMSVLAADRRLTVIRVLTVFGYNAIIIGVLVGLTAGAPSGLTYGLLFGITAALGDRIVGLPSNAWFRFRCAHAWLALRGLLPWRLMRFLDDAHRKGFLRRAGAAYEFRHARLADRLVARADADPYGAPPLVAREPATGP